MTPEELARNAEELVRLMRAAADEAQLLGTRHGQAAQNLRQFQTTLRGAGVNISDLARATQRATTAETEATASAKEFSKGMVSGARSFTNSTAQFATAIAGASASFGQFGSVIRASSDLLGGAITKLASKAPVLGAFVEETRNQLVMAAQFVLTQLDVIAKSFNELATVGATTIDGIAGLRDQFNKMGLVGLPEFSAAVRESALGLAALGGTTSKGAAQIAETLGQLTKKTAEGGFAEQLLNLGFTIEEIAKGTTQFIANQQLMGNRQLKTTRDLTLASVAYLKEIDELARATGRSRTQVMDEVQKNQADVKFRARIEELRASGQAKAADELENLVKSLGGPVADAIRASVAGVPLTREAQGAMVLMNGAIQNSISAINAGSTAERERLKIIQAGARGLGTFNKVIQYGASDVLGGDGVVKQLMDFEAILRRAKEQGKDPFELAREESEELAKTQNETQKDFVDAQIALLNFGRELQRLGFQGIKPATAAVELFSDALLGAVYAIGKAFGLEREGPQKPPIATSQVPAVAAAQKEAKQAYEQADKTVAPIQAAMDKQELLKKEIKELEKQQRDAKVNGKNTAEIDTQIQTAKQKLKQAQEEETAAIVESNKAYHAANTARLKAEQERSKAIKESNSLYQKEQTIIATRANIEKNTLDIETAKSDLEKARLDKEKIKDKSSPVYQRLKEKEQQQQNILTDLNNKQIRLEKSLQEQTEDLAESRKKLGTVALDILEQQKAGMAAGTQTYLQKMIQAESGGRNVANQQGPGGRPASTAYGVGQMTKGTFEGLAAKAGKGNPLQGKTYEDMQKDVSLQVEALRQFTDANTAKLTEAGIKITDASLYVAHFLGPDGAVRLLKSPDTTPIKDAVNADSIQSNPQIFQNMNTVADFKQWANNKMGNVGFQQGGISKGPRSGYFAKLHGTEAVIPLPSGKSIPMVITNMEELLVAITRETLNNINSSYVSSDQMAIMNDTLRRFDIGNSLSKIQSEISASIKTLNPTSILQDKPVKKSEKTDVRANEESINQLARINNRSEKPDVRANEESINQLARINNRIDKLDIRPNLATLLPKTPAAERQDIGAEVSKTKETEKDTLLPQTLTANFDQQKVMLGTQIGKLDELIVIMRRQASTLEGILRSSTA